MGKKKSNNEGEKDQNDQKKKSNDGGKKDDGPITVVLKVDIDCEGCATKVKKCIRSFEGVESVKGDDGDLNKITVTGKVDPSKLREKLEKKTKKKVELVSPSPKKEKDKDKQKDKESGGGEKKTEDKPEKKPDEKKPKEPPVTTAVLKMDLHCVGCIKKIHKTVGKAKGYQEMSIDRQKDLVTVKGTMDANALAESLKKKLKRPVEIVPPKKEGGGGGGEKKEKGGGGEKKEKGGGGGGEKKENGGGGGGEKKEKGGESKGAGEGGGDGGGAAEFGYPYPYPYPYYPMEHVHAPQLFSDENPNACSVM